MFDGCLEDIDEGSRYRRVEVITGRRRRRNWTAAEKALIVSESAVAGANISDVARRHGVNRALLSVWRRQAGLSEISGSGQFVPVTSEAPTPCEGRTVEPSAVDVDLRAGRVRFSGAVDPSLARAVLTALRGAL
ncbi:IS66 family insertion sequence hypothetical protein (plasmid) [Niveispirillum cyanobacteriorum]|uniref:Transposase n=2 Tax=Niveispirillum cyanobacteriorum TaxID=1612173 RepID=A0A2K9NLD2_9PROT|nr:IS66 family insertion sequence hypothetical protein [Niveispirillum cyanobacteriorum]